MTLLVLTNSFESGTDGTAVSTANSGGLGSTAFDSVTASGGGSCAYSASQAAQGSLSAVVATSAVAGSAYVEWTSTSIGTISAGTALYGRLYINLSSLPPGTDSIIRFQNGGSFAGSIQLTSAGNLRIQAQDFSVPVTFTSVLPTNQWTRIEFAVTPNAAGSASMAVRYFATAQSTTATEAHTDTAKQYGGGSPIAINDVRFGWTGSDTSFPSMYMDSVGLTNDTWMGPNLAGTYYSDLYTDAYTDLYGQFLGTPWPQSGALGIEVDLLLNGTWTDITGYAMQRDGSINISISHGRPDESSKIVTAKCTIELNNRDGAFSSKNTSSPFYPYIGRNTQLRVLVPVSYNGTDAGQAYAFWGEVPSWIPSWDTSGNDIWVNITASGYTRRGTAQATLGSALSRFYLQKNTSDPTYPVAYWTCEDGSTSTTLAEVTGNGSAATFTGSPTLASDDSFGGSDPIPVLNGSAWTALTGSFADPGSITYSNPGTYSFVPRSGLTTLTSAECWAASGGGTNGYQANSGKGAAGGAGEYAKETSVAISGASSYTVVVGAGGRGGTLASGAGLKANPGADGGNSTFTADSVTVTTHGGKGGTFTGTRGGDGGTGSTNATHHDGGAGGKNSGALFGGSGGGSSGGTSAAGNAGSNGGASNTGAAGGVAVTGGGAGGKGGNGGFATSTAGASGGLPGGGGGSGGEDSATAAAHSGGNGGAGKVKLTWTPLTAPAYNVVRFLLHVPAGGDTNNAVVARFLTAGTVAKVDLVYTTATGGTLTLNCYNSVGGLLSSSAAAVGLNGVPAFISMELTPGATIGYALRWVPASGLSGSFQTAGTASASGSVAAVTQVLVNPDGALSGTSIGHVLLQYSFESFGALLTAGNSGFGPLTGWNQERVGHRFVRLLTEEGVQSSLIGDVSSGVSSTPQMGPQPNGKLLDVLQQGEDLDGGLIIEPTTFFGLTYRAYASLLNQNPAISGVVADYSLAHLSPPFQPVDDDQLTRNIVTVSRTNGSSATARLDSGAQSTQDPPNGVGQYTYSTTVNAYQDSQLPGVATRILALGTVDEYRWPQINFQLSRGAVAQLFSSLVQLIEGDYLQILNPPSFLGVGTIDLLALGFTITLNAKRFDIGLNCIPESPFG
jgi:hypothetical protein